MDISFRDVLLTRHDEHDWICVSAYKLVNGKFVVSERFCNGVDEAAGLIERSYQREDIGAIWSNLQRLKPGSSRRKKGETIDSYTNILVDIDRKQKKINDDGAYVAKDDKTGHKCNATDEERAVLYEVAGKIDKFLSKWFGAPTLTDSGNGYHVSWRCRPMTAEEGREYYSELLAMLRDKFEAPGVNMEIDLSLADDTQVVTVPGTWNRKYLDTFDRPQRRSKALIVPSSLKEISAADIMLCIAENPHKAELDGEEAPRLKKKDWQKANPDWLENYGVPDLVEHFAAYMSYEKDMDVFEKDGDEYHPVTPCYAHEDEPDGHEHSTPKDCCIIVFKDGGVGLSCWTKDLGLKSVIKRLNEKIIADGGEKYPMLLFAEESHEEIAAAFGAVNADAVPTPIGEICYRENCTCGSVHVQRQKPVELFEETEGEFELWREGEVGITGIRLSDVKERAVEWLWKGRLPAGCGMVVSGAPGTNKSMLSLSLVACVTNGADWPDGEKNEMGPREVLIAATEDTLETTIKPRLMAIGADMSKITSIKNVFDVGNDGKRKSRDLNLDGDAAKLYRMLKARPEILMVVLDPLTGFFGDVDGNDNRRIRPMMQRIAKVCRLTGVAFVLLIHENKRGDANAVDKILGAGAVAQVVRAGIRISKDPKRKPDGRIMANIKGNLSRDNGGMKFDVKSTSVTAWDGTVLEDIGYIEWGEKHSMSADDVMDEERQAKKDGGDDTKLGQAVKILEDALIGGKRLQRDVHRLLDAAGISDATKRRAKAKVGVRSTTAPPWLWWIDGAEQLAEPAPEKTMAVGEGDAL